MATPRGSIWKNTSKKRGYSASVGSYNVKKGDRFFTLTRLSDGKKRVYESPRAAMADGWFISQHGK